MDPETYRLKENVTKLVAAGIHVQRDDDGTSETIDLDPRRAEQYADYLEPIPDGAEEGGGD